ncbi:hypothetical protein DO021_21345 [Desulfobacter hydrogenophilus]|uniref:Uncharacterized protein n=1 Tax=Desulfobacter hydrogenophilus TaxID=2291 RepID=A0A328F696_9BACT|nr:hypothetical protein DO021_21345 [Desulfobacter hydrogenophilus]
MNTTIADGRIHGHNHFHYIFRVAASHLLFSAQQDIASLPACSHIGKKSNGCAGYLVVDIVFKIFQLILP